MAWISKFYTASFSSYQVQIWVSILPACPAGWWQHSIRLLWLRGKDCKRLLGKKVKYFCTVTKVWRSLRQREEESCILLKQNTRKSGFVFSLFYFLGENNFSGLLEENHSDAKLHKSFSVLFVQLIQILWSVSNDHSAWKSREKK